MTKVLASFTGNNGVGAISVPGVKKGDAVVHIVGNSGAALGLEFTDYPPIVLVDDEIYQPVAVDRSGDTILALLDRDVVITL